MEAQTKECQICFSEIENLTNPCKQCHIEMCVDCIIQLTKDAKFQCPQCTLVRDPCPKDESRKDSKKNDVRIVASGNTVVHIYSDRIEYQSNTPFVCDKQFGSSDYKFEGDVYNPLRKLLVLEEQQRITEIAAFGYGTVVVHDTHGLFGKGLRLFGSDHGFIQLRDGVVVLMIDFRGEARIWSWPAAVSVDHLFAHMFDSSCLSGIKVVSVASVFNDGNGRVTFRHDPNCEVNVHGDVSAIVDDPKP